MSNRNLLTIIMVLLTGVLVILLIDMNQQTPAEKIAGSFQQLTTEVGSEVRKLTSRTEYGQQQQNN